MARKKRKILPVKKTTYTGLLGPQTQGNVQRGAFRQPTGMTSITQGQGLGEVGGESLTDSFLTPLLAAKGAKKTVEDMHSGGQKLGEGISSIPDYAEKTWDYLGDRASDIGNVFSDSPANVTQMQGSTNYSPAVAGARPVSTTGYNAPNRIPPNANANFYSQTPVAEQLTKGMLSQGASPSTVGSGGTLDLPPTHMDIFKTMPTDFGKGITGAYSGGYNAMQQGQGIFAPSAEMVEASGGLLEGMGATGKYAGDAYTGMQGAQGAEAATAAAGAEASLLSKVGSLAGIGLNAYDIAEQGVTANNMMGLLGSGVLASTAMLGLANSWNPVGWALLAASAVGSLTDWW